MKDIEQLQMEIPFLRASFPEGLHADLAEVFDSGYVGAGESVFSFEQALREYLGGPAVMATSSCTAALTLAYVTAGVKQGSVVLSTPMTCAATNIPLLQLGAKIEWMDIDPLSGNVTPESVAEGLEREPGAQAVVIMDWGGVPCDYASIVAECRRRGKPLILDAAQSFGSLHGGERYPHEIDFVCYSFGPTKLFSTVEGGAVAPRESLAAERIDALRWYGIRRGKRNHLRFWEYQVKELGYRFVFNNLFATIGLRMLSRIEDRLSHHRKLAHLYDEMLCKVSGLRIGRRLPESNPNFWLYTVLAEERESLLYKLHSQGIHAATPHSRNDHLLADWNSISTSTELAGVGEFNQNYVCLPIGPWVKQEDAERIGRAIASGW